MGGKVSPREGLAPVDLLGKGDEVANLIGSSLTEKRERPPLLQGNAESSFDRDLGVSVLAFPHLKPTATAWPGGEGGGHPREDERRAGAAPLVLCGVWLGGAARFALAPLPRLRGAALEAPAPVA